jgi:hypothetical protein
MAPMGLPFEVAIKLRRAIVKRASPKQPSVLCTVDLKLGKHAAMMPINVSTQLSIVMVKPMLNVMVAYT